MENIDKPLLYILIVGIIVALLPLVKDTMQRIDFKRQVNGKKPLFKSHFEESSRNGEGHTEEYTEADRIMDESRLHSFRDLFGPK